MRYLGYPITLRQLDRTLGWQTIRKAGVFVEPSQSLVYEGTVISGSKSSLADCDDTYWQIQATASGIHVYFSFNVAGESKKVKLKGRWAGGAGGSVLVQAWDGASWDTIETITESGADATYLVSLGPEYTINGVTSVRVFRATGSTNHLYLDCIHVLTSEAGENLNGGPGVLTNHRKGNDNGQGTQLFGATGIFNDSAGGNSWSWFTFRIIPPSGLTGLPTGTVRITATFSGYTGNGTQVLKVMSSTDGYHNPADTPSLSDNTTGVTAGNGVKVLNGSGAKTFQAGYFAVDFGWEAPRTINGEITKVEWANSGFSKFWTLWEAPP